MLTLADKAVEPRGVTPASFLLLRQWVIGSSLPSPPPIIGVDNSATPVYNGIRRWRSKSASGVRLMVGRITFSGSLRNIFIFVRLTTPPPWSIMGLDASDEAPEEAAFWSWLPPPKDASFLCHRQKNAKEDGKKAFAFFGKICYKDTNIYIRRLPAWLKSETVIKNWSS